ncbi:hypothetical protein BCPG3_203 [Bacillus phage BCPG3]|nr:hypothetical protein BCPG1_049 [Bacillus phage BCPG1]QSJ04520.1 hypothetical protein BCPG3_203 [Bacillus phage BCPG3]
MSRMEYLKTKEEQLLIQLQSHIKEGLFSTAKTTLDSLLANQDKMIEEESHQCTPLGLDLEFDDLRVGDKFREETTTTNVDGIYYYHTVLFIAPTPDSSGNRTAFTKVQYLEDFWYSTVEEDYFK